MEFDLLEIVKTLAAVAAQRERMTPEQRAQAPDPLGPASPLVQAARRALAERSCGDGVNYV